ncbi:hypothetical protein EK904_010618 [Melospiza melodia maxima]|nr:hypothetical protein EK904_010618 [Melospiza melodia maxima]
MCVGCRWFCEGKELQNSPDIQIHSESGGLHSLIIVEAFEDDTGRYTCLASNSFGSDSTSAEIFIEVKIWSYATGPKENHFCFFDNRIFYTKIRSDHSCNSTYLHAQSAGSKPYFIPAPSGWTQAYLFCTYFYKEEICTLVIAETFPEDSGIFTCTATNEHGSVTSSAQLTVCSVSGNCKGKEEWKNKKDRVVK